MRISSVPVFGSLFALWLIGTLPPEALATSGIGTGPAVGSDFDVVAIPTITGDPGIYVAWRDHASNISSGVLGLDDEVFTPFPTLQSGYISNLNVGAGGPVTDRRAYVTWVGNQLELVLAVFDVGGTLVSPPQNVANSIQISPNRLAGTDAGVLVGHIWDTNPYWDPRIIEVDVSGNVVGLEVVESVGFPEQTLGITVAATPGGTHAIVYITSDTHDVRLRRYDGTGPLDPSPVTISGDATSDVPLSALFLAATVPSTGLVAFRYQPPGSSPDVRFTLVPLSAGPVSVGPTMSELVPGFLGMVSDVEALSDPDLRAVVVWQEIQLEDPETCGCTVPQPVRVDFFAQILDIGGVAITAEGPPLLVYRWEDGDAIGPPISEPRVVVPSNVSGTFTVVWSDGVLRFRNFDLSTVGADPLIVTTSPLLASHPNPFTVQTRITFSLSQRGPVRLTIVDVTGREVARLVDSVQPDGRLIFSWDGTNGTGARVPAGVYFARLASQQVTEAIKLVLVE